MFGIDAPELLVIAVVALIFIGPKELPAMLRTIGKWVATARNMAGEFRGHVDDMMRQAELDELKKQVEAGAKDAVLDLQGLDPTREIKAAIDEGASEADKEMQAARASIDAATADAALTPPVTAGELTAPVEPAASAAVVSGDVPPSEPEFAAVPPTGTPAGTASGDVPQISGPDQAAAGKGPVPVAANEPQASPQKVAAG
jgi:sec-independent protein translocase protein TatB